MSKISRVTQLIFGSGAGSDQLGVFGSLAAGSPAYTTDPSPTSGGIQSLSNYLTGWFGAIVGANSPAIQDMNSICFLYAYQLAYLFQAGVPEWDSATIYYQGSFCQVSGVIYVSQTNANTGNSTANLNFWRPYLSPGFNPQATQQVATRAVSNWTAETAASGNNWNSIVWSPELALFAACANSGSGNIMTSSDGKSWSAQTSTIAGISIAWSSELRLFVAVGTGGAIQTSPDGTTWTSRTTPSTEQWFSVCWSPGLALFVACAETGGTGTNQFMTSTNGTSWTGVPVAGGESWSSVTWSPELEIFVAVAFAGTNRVATSPDGATWTLRSASAAKQWNAVAWSPQLGLFAAVSLDGAVMTSPNGTTWTNQTPVGTTNAWSAIAWSPELGCFTAVSQSGTDEVMFSFDGITWTGAVASSAVHWNGIAWSPALGIFSSVANTGSGSARAQISRYVQKFY